MRTKTWGALFALGLAVLTAAYATASPPPNDSCTAPTVIPTTPYTDAVDTTEADGGGGPVQCAFTSKSVWYSFTAPADAVIVFDTFGSDYDTVVSAYVGDCDALSRLACNDDYVGAAQSRVALRVTAGQTVLFVASSRGSFSAGGNLVVHLDEYTQPPTTYPGFAPDPEGDLLELGHDVVSFAGCYSADVVGLTMRFRSAVLPYDSAAPNALAGFVEIDVDSDAGTGQVPPISDAVNALPSGLGVEYRVDLYSTAGGVANVVSTATSETVGQAQLIFIGDTVAISIPRAVLGGDDGIVRAAAVVGTFLASDVVPDGGHLATVACGAPACGAAPAGGCRTSIASAGAKLKLVDKTPDKSDSLGWKLAKGDATAMADFGVPQVTMSFRMCVWDDVGGVATLRSSAEILSGGTCAGKPCWKGSATGFTYKNAAGTSDGVIQLKLKAGAAGKASIDVKGKGEALDMPTLPLAQAPGVTVQLLSSGGTCWSSHFGSPATRNVPGLFNDKSD